MGTDSLEFASSAPTMVALLLICVESSIFRVGRTVSDMVIFKIGGVLPVKTKTNS